MQDKAGATQCRSRERAVTGEGTDREGCLKAQPYCPRPEGLVPESENDPGWKLIGAAGAPNGS